MSQNQFKFVAFVLLAYAALMIGLSLYCSKKSSKDGNSFFRGNGRTPWWVVAIAMISTSISGVTFVSVPGMVEKSGFSYLQMVLGFVAGYVFIAYVLLPLYYKQRVTSLYEYVDSRFGPKSYKTAAGLFLISKLLACGLKLYLTAIVLQFVIFEALGVPFWLNVVGTMILMWAYTFRGGVGSIVWTDMLQTLVLLGTVAWTILAIGTKMHLNINEIYESIRDSGISQIWWFDDFRDTRYFWKQFVAGMFTTIAMTGLDQDMMQKNLSCRSFHASRKNLLSYGMAFLPVNLLFLSLGVLLYLFAREEGIVVAKPDDLFAAVSFSGLMPPIVGVLFCLGLVSASFSSGGSALTALTTSFTLDILGAKNSNKLHTIRERVHIIVTIAMMLIVYLFRIVDSESVINVVYKMVGYTYGPLLGLYLFGIWGHRPVRDSWVPWICLLSPLICLLLSTHSESWLGGYKIGFELLIINAAITAALLWLSGVRDIAKNH